MSVLCVKELGSSIVAMISPSTTVSETKISTDSDAERTIGKRPYNRKSLLCRLCLRVLPKNQLPEIFTPSSNIQKAIRTAVGTEVNRKDRSVRICLCCLELVHLVNDYRAVCERTELLFSQNVELSDNAFWSDEVDHKVFEKCQALVEQCRTAIFSIYTKQTKFFCNVKTEQLLDESCNEAQEPAVETISSQDEILCLKTDNIEEVECEDEHLQQSNTENEESVDDSDENDPDYKVKERLQLDSAEIKTENENKAALAIQQNQIGDTNRAPRRRGRPSLPEEQLKHRRRKPGEPKKKPGPKNRIKLPAQSVCEICGMMVSRENQERHRNDHLGYRPYACTMEGCTHAFSSKAGLQGHLTRHADRNNIYDCDICGAKIKTKSSLHRHRKMHTTEKPHACDICGKRFWRKSYLNHHATVHTGIAKFPCEYCGFVFKNKYWRSFHIKQKHVAKGEAPKFEALEELAENEEMAEVLEYGVEIDSTS